MEVQGNFLIMRWDINYYACAVSAAAIRVSGTEITAFHGNHQEGRTNFDVEMVWFGDTTVEHFPRGMWRIFPNLKVVMIFNCGLRALRREDFEGLQDLEKVSFDNNNLRSLPSNLFEGMGKLKKVMFNNNKLAYMSSNLLVPIYRNQLTFVQFMNNTRIGAFYDPNTEGSVESVRELMRIIDRNCEPPIEGV
jgi:Leucine rich repeat